MSSNPYRTQENVAYAPTVSLRLGMDILIPHEIRHRLALLCVHGGGWDKGDKDALRSEIEYFAGRGWVSATVNYRLSGDALFPAQYHDVWNAVQYLSRQHGRVVLMGHSAGGHLVAYTGLKHGDASHLIAGVIGVSGVYDVRYETVIRQQIKWRNKLELLFGGSYEDERIQATARLASPIELIPEWTHVPGDAPRFLLLHGEHDTGVPVAQATEMRDAMEAANLRVDLKLVSNAAHYVFHEQRTQVLSAIEAFLVQAEADAQPRR